MSDNDEYYQIVNWQKYQQPLKKRPDGRHVERTWVKFWHKMLHHRLWDYSPSHAKVFMTMLVLSSDEGCIQLDHKSIRSRSRVGHHRIKSVLSDLEQLQLISRGKSGTEKRREEKRIYKEKKPSLRSGKSRLPGDEKNQHQKSLEELITQYPNKIGKAVALKRLGSSVKTKKDREDFQRAVENYLAFLRRESAGGFERRPKDLKTFCSQWRDFTNWEELESKSATGPKHEEIEF